MMSAGLHEAAALMRRGERAGRLRKSGPKGPSKHRRRKK